MAGNGIPIRNIFWVSIFAVAFAYVESSVVVYLRAIYYPTGFEFPLKLISTHHLTVELAREAATIVMLAVAGILAGGKGWEKFGYFLIAFGVWDVFYYVWLKVVLNWPLSLTDWDVLFLIPLPWIGPVIAPVVISLMMIVCGVIIVIRLSRGHHFRPVLVTWLLAFSATLVVLYSFTLDIAATLQFQMPAPYRYELLITGLLVYAAAFVTACRPTATFRSPA